MIFNELLILEGPSLSLGFANDKIVAKKPEGEHKYDIESIKQMVCVGNGIDLSSELIKKCASNHIDIFFVDKTDLPYAALTSVQKQENVALQKAQISLPPEKVNFLIKSWIRAKLHNQGQLLKYFFKYEKRNIATLSGGLDQIVELIGKKLENISSLSDFEVEKIRQNVLINEALASKVYWQGVGILLRDRIPFYGRDAGDDDLFNRVFNIGYHLLYAKVWRALVLSGLNPHFGFLHHRQNQPSLVCDFIEQFRQAIVDRAIISLFRKKKSSDFLKNQYRINAQIYQAIGDQLNKSVKYYKEQVSFSQIIESEAKKLSQFISRADDYSVFNYRWANNY